jgi:hypothetical protein
MPRVSLAAGAFREGNQVDRFEQLKLERHEGHRLWIPNQDYAWMEFRHNIKAPVFADDGKPLQVEKKVRGAVRLVFDMEEGGFIGAPICLGDPDVIATQELDADGCPACAGVKRMLDAGIADARDLRPQQRYAVPVIRYATQKKGEPDGKLRNPPNAEIFVWALSQWSWEQVDGIRRQMAALLNLEDAAAVKLQMCDICVSNENGYQKIDKIWPMPSAWRHDSDAGRAVKAVIQGLWGVVENRPTEEQLQAACGRTSTRDWIDRDIRDAEARWHQAVNWGKSPAPSKTGNGYLSTGEQALSLDGGLDDLLGDPDRPGPLDDLDEFASPERTAAPAPAPVADDDLFGSDDTPAAAVATPAPAPVANDDLFGSDDTPAAPVPAAVGANGATPGAQSFKDILNGLDDLQ